MMKIGRDRIAAHEAALLEHALRRLSAINNLRIIGRARNRGAIISFNMDGAHAHDVATVIDRAGRGGSRRHPLHHAAPRPFRHHCHLSRLFCHVQYP